MYHSRAVFYCCLPNKLQVAVPPTHTAQVPFTVGRKSWLAWGLPSCWRQPGGGVASKPQGGAVLSSEGSASRKAHDVECMAPRIWPSRQLSLPLGPNVRGAKVGCHIFGHTQTDIYSGCVLAWLPGLQSIPAGMKIPFVLSSHSWGSSADRRCGGGDLAQNVALRGPLAAVPKEGSQPTNENGILDAPCWQLYGLSSPRFYLLFASQSLLDLS